MLALALLAGCGGSSEKDDYADSVRSKVVVPLGQTSDEAQALTGAGSAAEISKLSGEVLGAYDEAIAGLEKVRPPEDIAATQRKLIGVLEDVRGVYAGVKRQADSGNASAVTPAVQSRLQQALTSFGAIAGEFADKGYDLGDGG
jgi:hypothetical protein